VLIHPFVLGELACGNLKNRREVLRLLSDLPSALVATDLAWIIHEDAPVYKTMTRVDSCNESVGRGRILTIRHCGEVVTSWSGVGPSARTAI
jgi:hypothetical protein